MDKVNLQEKTHAQAGHIEFYWFENAFVGLKKTRFHRIQIPLKPFDSGLEWVQQPEETVLHIDWIKLTQDDATDLDGLVLSSETYPDMEASIYVGSSHNWTIINKLTLTKIDTDQYEIEGDTLVCFEDENVAENEPFYFKTQVIFKGQV